MQSNPDDTFQKLLGIRVSQKTFNEDENVENQQAALIDSEFDNLNFNRGNIIKQNINTNLLVCPKSRKNTSVNQSPSTANFNSKSTLQEKERKLWVKNQIGKSSQMTSQ